jgi:hypothetical protein
LDTHATTTATGTVLEYCDSWAPGSRRTAVQYRGPRDARLIADRTRGSMPSAVRNPVISVLLREEAPATRGVQTGALDFPVSSPYCTAQRKQRNNGAATLAVRYVTAAAFSVTTPYGSVRATTALRHHTAASGLPQRCGTARQRQGYHSAAAA